MLIVRHFSIRCYPEKSISNLAECVDFIEKVYTEINLIVVPDEIEKSQKVYLTFFALCKCGGGLRSEMKTKGFGSNITSSVKVALHSVRGRMSGKSQEFLRFICFTLICEHQDPIHCSPKRNTISKCRLSILQV